MKPARDKRGLCEQLAEKDGNIGTVRKSFKKLSLFIYPITHSLRLNPIDQEVSTSFQRQDPRAVGPHSGVGVDPGIHHLTGLFSCFSVPL